MLKKLKIYHFLLTIRDSGLKLELIHHILLHRLNLVVLQEILLITKNFTTVNFTKVVSRRTDFQKIWDAHIQICLWKTRMLVKFG